MNGTRFIDFGKVNYYSDEIPKNYKCDTCGVYGCKLWREYQTSANQTELVCVDCAGKSQNVDVSGINPKGEVMEKTFSF